MGNNHNNLVQKYTEIKYNKSSPAKLSLQGG